jgi:L-alanine-DL-glutamate epimerase-like enolase superfamily enzyme
MKFTSACIYPLNLPFSETFSHSQTERNHSDSIILKLTDESGCSGFGEGVPRPYVTGETRERSVEYIRTALLPRILGIDIAETELNDDLTSINKLLPCQNTTDGRTWNASRSAVELAAVDCLLRRKGESLQSLLPGRSDTITYSGVISSGDLPRVARIAHQCKEAGLDRIKVKVCNTGDTQAIEVVRDALGPLVSIRLDANGAFSTADAARFLDQVVQYDIACIEQPIPRGNPEELAALRSTSPIPIMADESVITINDAKQLQETGSVDSLNLRLSKCGGIQNTLAIARFAKSKGIGIQLGCQVGETAILSAAGRHIAAHLDDLLYVEGSYGTHLLEEDISREDLSFEYGGVAPVLEGNGFGITIDETILEKHAVATIHIG